ncbi:MAG: hypothetical protein IPK80_02690 [Nannocystis sp.]|nr:hypothetical protein [Nannocystis sp.]
MLRQGRKLFTPGQAVEVPSEMVDALVRIGRVRVVEKRPAEKPPAAREPSIFTKKRK